MKKKKSSLSKKTVGVAAAVILATGGFFLFKNEQGKSFQVPAYSVLRVIDGDTFETKEKQLIRLSSLDAPEVDRCWGPEAKKALENLILDKPLYLKVQYRDPHYRLISVVYTSEGSVNETMVKEGNGYYAKTGKDTGDEMLRAAEYAREHKKGIYSPKCTQTTNIDNPTCQIKGNTRDEYIYYKPNCGFYNQVEVQLYRGDRWFCTEQEAQKAGFRKPSQCP